MALELADMAIEIGGPIAVLLLAMVGIIGIVYKKIIPIIANRSCPRIRISPSTKWNEYGNRHGNGKK